jgi:hypothetical protein
MLGQKHLYCGFRPTTPESTPVPRTSQGLCHFHVFGKFVKYIDPPLGQVLHWWKTSGTTFGIGDAKSSIFDSPARLQVKAGASRTTGPSVQA